MPIERILAELDEAWDTVQLYDGLAGEVRRLWKAAHDLSPVFSLAA